MNTMPSTQSTMVQIQGSIVYFSFLNKQKGKRKPLKVMFEDSWKVITFIWGSKKPLDSLEHDVQWL